MKTIIIKQPRLWLWTGTVVGCLLLAPLSQAAEVSGVTLADQIAVDDQTLELNGAGLRKKFVFDVYVAALYTTTPTTDAHAVIDSTQPRRLELTLLRDIDGATLMEALDDGLKDNTSAAELAQLAPTIEQFQAMMNNVGQGQSGNKIILDFTGQGVKVGFQGQQLGQVTDPRFAAALLRVWLGDKPAQGSLKQALLGHNNK